MGRWGIRVSFCMVLVVGGLAGIAGAAAAAIPQGNLVANGDAEAGPGATDSYGYACPPAWNCSVGPDGGPTAVRYGTPYFPDAGESQRMGGGLNFFAGGPNQPTSGISQFVDVTGAAAEVDAAQAQVTASACLGGNGAQADSAFLTAGFHSDTGGVGQIDVPMVTHADRNDATKLVLRAASGAVPPTTRRILVEVRFTRSEPLYNDGYADNITVTLSGLGTLPPATTCVGGTAPPPSPGAPTVDKKAAKLSVAARRLQRIAAQRAVVVKATPDEAATLSGKGTLSVPGASKVFRVKKATKTATAGQTRTLRMKISKKAVRAVRRALRRKRKVRAVVTVTAVDAAGNRSSAKRRIRARR